MTRPQSHDTPLGNVHLKSLVWLVALAAAATTGPLAAIAQDIGFVEDFAWSEDREKTLKQLIPGTVEFYYFHCLHYQNTQQLGQADEILEAWAKRHNKGGGWTMMYNRQMLLRYETQPDAALSHLRTELKLKFDHQRERTLDQAAAPNLPNQLPLDTLERQRLEKLARTRPNLTGFTNEALRWLVNQPLNAAERRALLARLATPDYDNVVTLISDDLAAKDSGGFGSLPIHRQLTLAQLNALPELRPQLLNHNNYVNAYVAKLAPSDDQDFHADAKVQQAYLDRIWKFVSQLGPVHNTRKAHTLYHRLSLDRSRGVYNKQRFLAYLNLPRAGSYVNPKLLERQENRPHIANLSQSFEVLPPVGVDEPLVRAYLLHFFKNEDSYDAYLPLIRTSYLKQVFAEAKAVHGLGNAESWASLLTPEQYQALKDRIDLEFDVENKKAYRINEPVAIDIHVKNVSELIVKVFHINTTSYCRATGRNVNTDIELDGLIANQELRFKYADAPLRRIKRHFEFPELTAPGVYVLDFIGSGRNSRAVIRKGSVHTIVRTVPTGQTVTVFDEDNKLVQDAKVWFGGKLYEPNKQGAIVLPFSTKGRHTASMTVEHHGQSYPKSFISLPEQYRLNAGFVINRERLQSHQQAEVIVRPQLMLNGQRTSIELLQDAMLTLTATNRDGIVTTETKPFELDDFRESVRVFRTPARLAQLSFTLTGKVEQSTRGGEKQTVSATQTVQVNGIEATAQVADTHLAWINGQYEVHALGRTGEPLVDRAVHVMLRHRDFSNPIHSDLKTDAAGVVKLGALPGVTHVEAKVSNTHLQTQPRLWNLARDAVTHRPTIHGIVGETITLPEIELKKVSADAISLFELRGKEIVADRLKHVALAEGLLTLKDLPAGDYRLTLRQSSLNGIQIPIAVTAGPKVAGFGLGARRHLELAGPPATIADAKVANGKLEIRVTPNQDFVRLHVLSSRYLPAFDAFAGLSRPAMSPIRTNILARGSLYSANRVIGEEYDYILRRQAEKRYPGNMLERPSLLLNPWSLRATDMGTDDASGGERFDAEKESKPAPSAPAPPHEKPGRSGAQPNGAVLNWLDACSVIANIEPAKDGKVSIPIEALNGGQHVRILLVHPSGVLQKSLSLPGSDITPRDLQLAGGLDPAKDLIQAKQITVVGAGEKLVLRGGAAEYETFDSLQDVYKLYETLVKDSKFSDFRFVLDWPKLSADEKREKYSKFASHELHFFLFHKDRKFFDDVAAPYLASKRHKTFMDQFLLDLELEPFLDPWEHGQLNVTERILIGTRIASERPRASQHVADLTSLDPLKPERFDALFRTAMQTTSFAMDESRGRASTWAITGGGVMPNSTRDYKYNAPAHRMALPGANQSDGKDRDGDQNGNGAAKGDSRRDGKSRRGQTYQFYQSLGEHDAKQDGERHSQESLGRANNKELAKSRRRTLSRYQQNMDLYGVAPIPGLRAASLFRQVDGTKEWAENNYHHLPIETQNANLVDANRFWQDYAERDPDQPFVSKHLALPTGNFTECMLALAVLDLPFEPKSHKTDIKPESLELTAGSPMIVFHEEIREPGEADETSSILVNQNIFQQNDRFRVVENQRLDKYVGDELLTHTVYGCQIVVTNPTPGQQKLSLLSQIPVGAIPLNGAKTTTNSRLNLGPYSTSKVEVLFYFPRTGQFTVYPVHVSNEREVLLAKADARTLKVVGKPTQIDRESWAYLSQNATNKDVLSYLKHANLQQLDLQKIAFRMTDAKFFDATLQLLTERHAYHRTLWSYAVKHNRPQRLKQFLKHEDSFITSCGPCLESPLVTIDPVARKTYQHLAYKPLVNARAHRLGPRRRILNSSVHSQYHKLLTIHSMRRQLDDDDRMAATYYLLLQDRIEEAMAMFAQVDPQQMDAKIQHDYLTAYLSFYGDDLKKAQTLADSYKDYPVVRWRDRFAAIAAQLREISGGEADVVDPLNREQAQTAEADKSPSFDFKVDSGKVSLRYQNIQQAKVRYYLMDIELLFSRNPFVKQFDGQFSYIRPNAEQDIKLKGPRGAKQFDLPAALNNQNVLIEISADGVVKTDAYYSNSLNVQVVDRFGQLTVNDAKGNRLPKSYVKVFARMKNGAVKFYKDGYTDLRGQFDYASLSTNQLDQIQQFSILVMSEKNGSVVREASPPAR